MAGTPRAVKVSFDRPFADDGSGLVLNWDIQFIRWVEQAVYDVTYSSDVYTHANGGELLNHRAFLSIGHNEYWSNEMVNSVQNARDAGINVAFFGANPIYWQVRYEASAAGVANRVLVCYKNATIDPVQGPTTTVRWRDAPVSFVFHRPRCPTTSSRALSATARSRPRHSGRSTRPSAITPRSDYRRVSN